MTIPATRRPDEAVRKGAVEEEAPPTDRSAGQQPFAGQLGHRDQDDLLKDNDTDFPEPDAKAEHTGQ
jgi:hypothetical protein